MIVNPNLINRSTAYQNKISPRNKNIRSNISRNEEPLDVEPLDQTSIKNLQNSESNDNEILDIEDPW